MYMISVVVPTYNEAANIRQLLEEIDSVFSQENESYEILVVDDNSPDGTGDIVEEISEQEIPQVKLLTRAKKEGLGAAYKFALPQAEGDIIVHMDADFSHKPEEIPKLIESIKNGADVAIGSRYVTGGKRKDPWYRRIFPQLGKILYRPMLPIKDPTSGFKAYKKQATEELNWEDLPNSFAFQAASLHQLHQQGFELEEIAINFSERRAGEQKYSWRELASNLKLVSYLFFQKYLGYRFFKFCLVGASGVLVNMGLLWVLTEKLGLFYLHSSALAIETSILTNFVLNEQWTWRERNIGTKFKRLMTYNVVSLGGLAVNMTVLWLLTSILGLYYLISNLGGIASATLLNFLINDRWTWQKSTED